MFSISNYQNILAEVKAGNATLVAVSKTKTAPEILHLYNQGQRIFGENKVQELVSKYEQLPKDISWHLIGHLQSNKVKYIAPFVTLIHSVDSYKLLQTISKEAIKCSRTLDCLLQVHIAEEETKFGFLPHEITPLLQTLQQQPLPNIRICGLMGMATFTDNTQQIQREFKTLADLFKKINSSALNIQNHFTVLSMGMSSDYKLALAQGSNMVRIGSLIFGARTA